MIGKSRIRSLTLPAVALLAALSLMGAALWSNLAGSAGNAEYAANAGRLGGQLPSAYAAASHTHDAANITSGTLAVAHYSAIADLTDEGYLGNASGDLAVNNGVVQANLNADLLDGNHSSAFAATSHTHTGATIVDGSLGTADLADGSVTSAKIADGGVALADLAANSVDSSKIV